ncbi:hypothetical protein, partial [Erwinia amylovora]|uniref:hypothetical protein n=1 Tax=Erwinia amylovora TaxID=552 RepID=UPI0020BEF31F
AQQILRVSSGFRSIYIREYIFIILGIDAFIAHTDCFLYVCSLVRVAAYCGDEGIFRQHRNRVKRHANINLVFDSGCIDDGPMHRPLRVKAVN